MLTAKIDGKITSSILDTGACISVVKRGLLPTPTPPVSKLKLKGVLPCIGQLYGPKIVKFEINDKRYQCPIYEADIQEDCLLGLNFIGHFYCLIDPIKCEMIMKFPQLNIVQLKKKERLTNQRSPIIPALFITLFGLVQS